MHESPSSALATESPTADHDHGSIGGTALKVFVALCVLTCASLLTYTPFWQEHVPMRIGRAVMLTVSITKAFLVVAFFMHLWWESKWKYVVTFPAMVVSALLCIALVPDVGQRTAQYDHARWLNAPEPMPYTVGPQSTVSQPELTTSNAQHSHERRGAESHGAERRSIPMH